MLLQRPFNRRRQHVLLSGFGLLCTLLATRVCAHTRRCACPSDEASDADISTFLQANHGADPASMLQALRAQGWQWAAVRELSWEELMVLHESIVRAESIAQLHGCLPTTHPALIEQEVAQIPAPVARTIHDCCQGTDCPCGAQSSRSSSAYTPGHNSVPAAGQNGGVEAAAPGTKARHSAPAGYGEWAVTAERERVLECETPTLITWPRDGAVILPHVSAGQPVLMLQAHICGLADVRHDNTFHLRTFLNGSVIFMGDLIVDEEGSDVRMPLIGSRAQMEEAWGGSGKMPSLETGVHEVVLQLWVGPRGEDGTIAKTARITFVVDASFARSWTYTPPRKDSEFWGGGLEGFSWAPSHAGLPAGAQNFRAGAARQDSTKDGVPPQTNSEEQEGGVYSEVRCSGGIQEFSFPLLRAGDPKFWGTLADQEPETCQHSPHHARQVCVCVCARARAPCVH